MASLQGKKSLKVTQKWENGFQIDTKQNLAASPINAWFRLGITSLNRTVVSSGIN
jgi:hypothetical protein